MSSDGRPTGYNQAEPVAQSVTGFADGLRLADPVTGAGILTGNTDPLVTEIDPLTGLASPSGTDVGPAAFLRSAWKRLVLNGDFALPPPRTDWPINSDPSSNQYNPLPGWKLNDNSNGGIVLWWRADTSAGSGGSLEWLIGLGTASDEANIEQLVPMRSSRTQNNAYQGVASWFSATSDANPLAYMEAQPLKADSTTTTGSALTTSMGFIAAAALADLRFIGSASQVLPSDGGRIRLRVGVKRNTGAVGSSYTIKSSEIAIFEGQVVTVWPDLTTPANAPFMASVFNGVWRLESGGGIFLDVGAAGSLIYESLALSGHLDVAEEAVPSAPGSGFHRVFATAAGNLRSINDDGFRGSVHTVGLAPYAYPIGFPENDAITGNTNLTAVVAGLAGARAVPMALHSPMLLDSISIWNKDTANLRTAEWRLYLDSGAGSNTLGNITGCTGTFSFTPTVASLRNSAAATPGTYLAPGVYWLVIRNTSTAQVFSLGVAAVGIFATNMNRANASGAAALGTTIDLSGYTSPTTHVAVRLEGRIGAETGPL